LATNADVSCSHSELVANEFKLRIAIVIALYMEDKAKIRRGPHWTNCGSDITNSAVSSNLVMNSAVTLVWMS